MEHFFVRAVLQSEMKCTFTTWLWLFSLTVNVNHPLHLLCLSNGVSCFLSIFTSHLVLFSYEVQLAIYRC